MNESNGTTLPDTILLRTEPTVQHIRGPQRHTLVYFVPGNPGLISYYRSFPNHLQSQLQPLTDASGTLFTITGHSLAGFHLSATASAATPVDKQTRLPLNLQQQIADVEVRLALTVAAHQDITDIILIGHSVGAYILMSLLSRRHHHHHQKPPPILISSAICLFPTITDLHLSSSGRKALPLAHIPLFSHLIQHLARLLCALLSLHTLTALINRLTAHPHPAADVTAAFLRSPTGVRQAVFLAQHELLEMRGDEWADEVWGTAATTKPQTQLYFLYGAHDHWIADSTRDALIANRVGTEHRRGPRMEVDFTEGLPHDFCVWERCSSVVAGKVGGYVRELFGIGEGGGGAEG